MPYTVRERLEQLRDTPRGAEMPAFMKEQIGDTMLWDAPLRQLAIDAIQMLDDLEAYRKMHEQAAPGTSSQHPLAQKILARRKEVEYRMRKLTERLRATGYQILP